MRELELQIVQNKHTDRSEDSAATSEKGASKDSANKKASKAAVKYPRKRKIGGMGEETTALVTELSEVETDCTTNKETEYWY